MKVLHVMAGLGEASGVANIARRFARQQREQGTEAVLTAPSGKWNPAFFELSFARHVWRQARTSDEIWVHCSWTFPVWFGAWVARHFGRRLVVVPEGSFDPKRLHNHAGWKKRLVAPIDRWVLRQAEEVLALCQDEIGWVRAFEPAAKVRFERVPTFYRRVDQPSQPRNTSPLHTLFLGRADDPLKGVRFLKRAVEEINTRPTSCRPKGKSPIELRIESSLFGAEKEAAWDWCDVFCLPTLSENFGLVVAEALEHGKRVITTDGAPAWEQEEGRLNYLRGYREGTDETRVKLLRDALAALL